MAGAGAGSAPGGVIPQAAQIVSPIAASGRLTLAEARLMSFSMMAVRAAT
jgi:hypothetical protein